MLPDAERQRRFDLKQKASGEPKGAVIMFGLIIVVIVVIASHFAG
jgi:hypothetical protein